MLEVAAEGWVSPKALPGTVRFDPRQDKPGPVVIASALTRRLPNKDQRIVVVGCGEFLANSFAGNGGNVDLGLNMVNWLASDDRLLDLTPRPSRDSQLQLSQTGLSLIGGTLLLLLPLLLASWGGYLWWSRRRA